MCFLILHLIQYPQQAQGDLSITRIIGVWMYRGGANHQVITIDKLKSIDLIDEHSAF